MERDFLLLLPLSTAVNHLARIQNKSNTNDLFDSYKKKIQHVLKYYPYGVQSLHTDHGGKYENFGNGEHTEASLYTPHNNHSSDRMNKTIVESCRAVLEQAGVGAK